jgi:flagellar M-ring protein FliF
MTEFAQKINYQRALQGEITRTILSLSQIRDARVLLVLPEQSLFKQAANKAKASITLALKPGQALRPEQVVGIQRLVSASVPGIATQDVTILDQNGVALSRNAGTESEGEVAGTGRLDLKKETENYLARKAGEVLDRAFGPGQAMASVDVVLNVERAQVTTEDLVVPPGRVGQAATGVVVRERETLREAGAPTEVKTYDGVAPGRWGSSQREVEYAVGRRLEQIVSQPGSIRRLQAVAVVRQTLDANQQEQVRRLLAAAVGASFERGDTVVVHTLEAASTTSPTVATPASASTVTGREEIAGTSPTVATRAYGSAVDARVAIAFLLAMAIAVATLLWVGRGRRLFSKDAGARLSGGQREAMLAQVRDWMSGDTAREKHL